MRHPAGTGCANATVNYIGGAALAVRALEGDVNADCQVNVIDQQMVANHFDAGPSNASYDPFLDVEPDAAPDGDVDIRDLQVVYGRYGSTCDNPFPAQSPPVPPDGVITLFGDIFGVAIQFNHRCSIGP